MVENQRNLYRFTYLDNVISKLSILEGFNPGAVKLANRYFIRLSGTLTSDMSELIIKYFKVFTSLYWQLIYHLVDGISIFIRSKLARYRIIIDIRGFSVSVTDSRQSQHRTSSSIFPNDRNNSRNNRPWSGKSIRNRDHSRPGSSRFRSERPSSAKRIENGMIVKYLAEGRNLKLTQMGR